MLSPFEWMKPSTYEFISLNLFTSEGLKTKNRRNCFNLLLNGEIQFGPISCQGVKPPVVQSEWCAGLRLNSNFHKKYLKMKKKYSKQKKIEKKNIPLITHHVWLDWPWSIPPRWEFLLQMLNRIKTLNEVKFRGLCVF